MALLIEAMAQPTVFQIRSSDRATKRYGWVSNSYPMQRLPGQQLISTRPKCTAVTRLSTWGQTANRECQSFQTNQRCPGCTG